MSMRRNSIWLVVLLALVGCQNPVQQIAGTYAYKISGQYTVDDTEYVLSDEMGAMDIICQTDSTVLLTFNALRGPAYSTFATIRSKQLTLQPYERDVNEAGTNYHVTASGQGTIYDGTILITLSYQSTSLTADSLIVLCKKN